MRFSDFYASSDCSSTRSILGTHHLLTALAESNYAFPEINGHKRYIRSLTHMDARLDSWFDCSVVALPESLLHAGYYTVVAGKCISAPRKEVFPTPQA